MSSYSIPFVNGTKPQLSDAAFYADIRYDPNESLPNYIGLNITNGESTGATTWKVYKFTYSGTSTTRIQFANGSWDNRIALF